MLTLDTDWVAEMAKGQVEIRFRVTVRVDTGVTYNFVNALCSNIANPESAHTVSPVRRSKDIKTRKNQVDSLTVTLVHDGKVNDMIYNYGVRGAHVDIIWGAEPLGIASYEDFFAGIVDSVTIRDGFVELRVKTIAKRLLETNVLGREWVNKHPLEIADDIFDQANVSSEWYSATSLDPDTYTASISHWVVGRAISGSYAVVSGNPLRDPTEAATVLDDLAKCLDGAFFTKEDGSVEFTRFDSTTSASDHWTTNDYRDFEIVDLYGNLMNKCYVKSHFAFSETAEGYWQKHYWAQDDTSFATFGIIDPSGKEDNIVEELIENNWVNGWCELGTTMTGGGSPSPGPAGTFDGYGGEIYNICGMRWPNYSWPSPPAQPASAALSAARTAYFRIGGEVIEVDGCDPNPSSDYWGSWVEYYDESSGAPVSTGIELPCRAQFTIAASGRGALGTTAEAHAIGDKIYDITIPVAVANARVDRRSNGCPHIRCKTNASKHGLEEGDFVTMDVDQALFSMKGLRGLDSNVKFEIVNKEIRLGVDGTFIQWDLVYATQTSPPATSISSYLLGTLADGSTMARREDELSAEDFDQLAVSSGFALSGVAGYAFTVGDGVAYGGGVRTNHESKAFTAPASRDTYVYWDHGTNSIVRVSVATAAGAPSNIPATFAPLYLLEADGVEIHTTTDLRETDKLADGIVDTPALASLAVTTAKIGLLAVNTAQLAGGAVTNNKVDAAAGIVGTKLASGAGVLTHLDAAGALDNVTSITTRPLASMTGDLDDISDGGTYEKVAGVSSNLITYSSMTAPCVAPRHILRGDSFDGNMIRNGELQAQSRAIVTYPPDLWEMVDGASSWGTDAEWDAALGKIGSGSVILYAPSGYDCAIVTEETIPVETGVEYLFSALVQADARTGGDEMFLDVQWIEDDEETQDSLVTVWEEVVAVVDTWETHSDVATAPANARWCKVRVGIRDAYGGTDAHIQRVIMVRN